MPDETVTVLAVRLDTEGDVWIQLQSGGWCAVLESGSNPEAYDTREELEEAWGPTRPVRIVTTDPGRHDGELLAEIGALTRQLEAEKEAHAKTRENFAEHVGAEFPAVTTDPAGETAEKLRVAERERDSLVRRLNERWGQLEEARAHAAQLRDELDRYKRSDLVDSGRIVTTVPGPGRCGTLTPRSVSSVSLACQLVAGHLGWHKSGTCEWAEPVEAAGLSAEQEIRARALDFAARFHDPPADTVLLAVQFAGWIRDGRVPE